MLIQFQIIAIYTLMSFLVFVFPSMTVIYLFPKNEFTCSAEYNYKNCKWFIPSNITIVGIEYDNTPIGQYKIKRGNYYDLITCKIINLNNEKLEINEKISGFYDKDENYECFTEKKVYKTIKIKDEQNRNVELIIGGLLLTIFSLFLSYFLKESYLKYLNKKLEKNNQIVQKNN
uniref:Uncharacterized protein n=1 Tax=viral metagenome TaxID=1070528 RepID=A0A6C0ADS3_9ZZZZ